MVDSYVLLDVISWGPSAYIPLDHVAIFNAPNDRTWPMWLSASMIRIETRWLDEASAAFIFYTNLSRGFPEKAALLCARNRAHVRLPAPEGAGCTRQMIPVGWVPDSVPMPVTRACAECADNA